MKLKQINNKNKIVITLLLVIFCIKVFTLLTFNNVEWEPDSYMHFLELQSIYANFPQNLALGLNVWSKPLYIYPLGLVATVFNTQTFFVVEIVNILIFLLIAFIVYRIVLNIYKSFSIALLALLFTSLSLTLFKSSLSVLTEPIFTLMLVSSFYYLTIKKFSLASLFIGLSVLARIEGLFFIGLYLFYLLAVYRINLKSLIKHSLIAGIPFFIWNFLGFLNTGDILYFRSFFQSYSAGNYGTGTLLDYPKMFITKEFVLSILFIGSLIILLRNRKKIINKRLVLYSFLIFTGFVAVQAILWSRGAFGTAGLMRYFISVIPFLIIFICSSFYIVQLNFKRKYFVVLLFGSIIAQILLLVMYLTGTVVSTKEVPYVENYFIESGEWIKENYSEDVFVAADRPEILYYAQRDLVNSKVYFSNQYALKTPGIYVWTEWSPLTNKITKEDIESNAEFIKEFEGKVFVYEIK